MESFDSHMSNSVSDAMIIKESDKGTITSSSPFLRILLISLGLTSFGHVTSDLFIAYPFLSQPFSLLSSLKRRQHRRGTWYIFRRNMQFSLSLC
jgi:hypothetical protein